MKYEALINPKNKILKCRLLKIIHGALRVNKTLEAKTTRLSIERFSSPNKK